MIIKVSNTFWMEEVQPIVNKSMLKRPTKHSEKSLYRDYPHTTVNGKGKIGSIK